MRFFTRYIHIGHTLEGSPIIGNDVKICAGAIIVGNVRIGDNVIVGAGAVVTTDIPSNEVWAGVPAHKICDIDSYIEKHGRLGM